MYINGFLFSIHNNVNTIGWGVFRGYFIYFNHRPFYRLHISRIIRFNHLFQTLTLVPRRRIGNGHHQQSQQQQVQHFIVQGDQSKPPVPLDEGPPFIKLSNRLPTILIPLITTPVFNATSKGRSLPYSPIISPSTGWPPSRVFLIFIKYFPPSLTLNTYLPSLPVLAEVKSGLPVKSDVL